MKVTLDDTDITSVRGYHPDFETISFERVKQDRRIYYRMLANGKGTGSLTTPQGARQTIAYWRSKGWVSE
jgi:hypothetical protein